jgi:hypothetical protein
MAYCINFKDYSVMIVLTKLIEKRCAEMTGKKDDIQHANEETRQAWDSNLAFWDK